VVSLDFSVTYSFRPYHGPGVDSAPSENEYQEHFLGVKAAGARGWQPHHLHVPNVMKYGNPNILEASGPHRACYRTPYCSATNKTCLRCVWRHFTCGEQDNTFTSLMTLKRVDSPVIPFNFCCDVRTKKSQFLGANVQDTERVHQNHLWGQWMLATIVRW
jgi:hypothetical protein